MQADLLGERFEARSAGVEMPERLEDPPVQGFARRHDPSDVAQQGESLRPEPLFFELVVEDIEQLGGELLFSGFGGRSGDPAEANDVCGRLGDRFDPLVLETRPVGSQQEEKEGIGIGHGRPRIANRLPG